MIPEQLSLTWRDLEASGSESDQDLPQDTEVAPGIRRMDGRVIQVTENLCGGQMAQGPGDQPRVRGRGVGQTEWHPDELILSKRRGERRLLSVCAPYRDSMEGPSSVESREDAATCKPG